MSLPRRRSLFWTLAGAFFGVLVLAVLLQALTVLLVVEPVTRRWQQTRAEGVAARVTESLAEELVQHRTDRIERVIARTQQVVEGVRIYYVDENDLAFGAPSPPPGMRSRLGPLLRGEISPSDLGRRRPPAPPGGVGPGGAPGRAGGFDLEVLARSTVEVGGEPRGEVFVVQPRVRFNILGRVPERTLFFLPVALVLAGVAGLWIFLRLQRRLSSLEELAARVGEGNLDVRVDKSGGDEIGRLAARLNDMTERLRTARDVVESSERQRRQLLADIGHELATPLTTIRGYAETLIDSEVRLDAADRERYLSDVLHAAERMDRLIRDLLDLARLEVGGAELERETIDLASLVRNSVARFADRFEEAGLQLVISGRSATEMLVQADGLRLEQVVDNLLNNELRHVAGGGRVEVEVRAEDGRAWIVVRDDGPGFREQDLPHVFDRFYRGDASRTSPGTGLGLAIVREIARQHGGDALARASEAGGAEIRVWLPEAER